MLNHLKLGPVSLDHSGHGSVVGVLLAADHLGVERPVGVMQRNRNLRFEIV